MTTPTKGRVVWFYTDSAAEPLAAIIAKVHNEQCVNLTVFNEDGTTQARTNIHLVQPGTEIPTTVPYCGWPSRMAEPADLAPNKSEATTETPPAEAVAATGS